MATTLDDIAARLDRLEAVLLQSGMVVMQDPQPVQLNHQEIVRRQAHVLLGQGKHEESKALLRSLSSRRRSSHA